MKKLDIFALPFKFNFGQEGNEKKTNIGGIFSLIIILISSAYFAYLCLLYFDNRVQPSIAFSNQQSKDTFSMELTQNFIALKILVKGGKTLYEFQKEKGKTYLHVMAYYDETGNADQSKNQNYFKLIPCIDEHLQDYMCIDFKQMLPKDDFNFKFNPDSIEKYNFTIFLSICDKKKLSDGEICEEEGVIRNTLITYQTQIQVRLGLKQYNTKAKKIEDRVKDEKFYFDGNLSFYTKFSLQKTDLTVNEGFIIQQNEKSTFFSDYLRRDISASQKFLQEEIKQNLLGGLVIYMGSENINQYVQYPQFTSLLAQFNSVFNSLLILGIFCKFLAQSEILHNFAELQLKQYYKKTAEQLVEDTVDKDSVKQVKQGGQLSMWKYIQNLDFRYVYKSMKIPYLKKQINSNNFFKNYNYFCVCQR